MPKRGQTKANATARSKQQRAYNSRPEQKKNRAKRNAARRAMEKKGAVRKGDGKDVDHKRKLKDGGTNGKGNLRVKSKSSNRADNGGTGGRKPKRRKPTKRR
jgi:hypothetical protein